MNIKSNIINYLYDKDYIVSMYDNFLYVFNYKYLNSFNDKKIDVSISDRNITIIGNELLIVKMTKEELLIKGNIERLEVKYHE